MEEESQQQPVSEPGDVDDRARRIHLSEIEEWLETLESPGALLPTEGGDALASHEARLVLPLVLQHVCAAEVPIDALRQALVDPLPLHLVVLMQAGAVSLGLFDEALALETRTLKKYVVRGHGKAQSTHLRRRGKSRYGSRLRLQNAESLLRQTHDKLREWIDVYGRPVGLFYAAPIRLWSDAFQPRVDPALDADAGWIRIRRDLPVPTTALLLHVYETLCHGSVELRGSHGSRTKA